MRPSLITIKIYFLGIGNNSMTAAVGPWIYTIWTGVMQEFGLKCNIRPNRYTAKPTKNKLTFWGKYHLHTTQDSIKQGYRLEKTLKYWMQKRKQSLMTFQPGLALSLGQIDLVICRKSTHLQSTTNSIVKQN